MARSLRPASPHPTTGTCGYHWVADGRTTVAHLVKIETVQRHRRAGRYPALCGRLVIPASLTTEPKRECEHCHHELGKGVHRDE